MLKTLKFGLLNQTVIGMLSLILIFGTLISCVENSEIEEDVDELSQTLPRATNCDTSFPNLGPSASSSQTCSEVSNPVNMGTLDCRTVDSYGGYRNDGSWGEYKIEGGTTRYDGTRTRVERFFNQLKRGKNKKTVLTGTLRIVDLSDGNTCIIQSHAGGKIVAGKEKNSTNRSAQFLDYAKKDGDKVRIETHRTNNPYTTSSTTGNGGREIKFFKTLDLRKDYTFRYETGYNSSKRAYSKLKIGGTEKSFNHNHTTENVYNRYGAYGTSDTGDKTAHIRFKNINHCR